MIDNRLGRLITVTYTTKVSDHCHVTGKFRGAAHNDCNINYKFTGRIPVVFHNLRGYDSHLIMQAIGKVSKQIKCIPNNMGCMDFIDSFQFMSFSLEKLVDNHVKEGPTKCYHMTEYFGTEKIDLLLRKQIYPYEYPPKESFHSSLSGEDISVEDYAHAQYVWKDFNIQNLGKYHDLYVLNDVLSQGDVF